MRIYIKEMNLVEAMVKKQSIALSKQDFQKFKVEVNVDENNNEYHDIRVKLRDLNHIADKFACNLAKVFHDKFYLRIHNLDTDISAFFQIVPFLQDSSAKYTLYSERRIKYLSERDYEDLGPLPIRLLIEE